MNENDLSNYFASNDTQLIKSYCQAEIQKSDFDLSFILNRAHQMTLSEASLKKKNYKQRNWMAETMYGNIIGLMYDYFEPLMASDAARVPYLKLAKDIRIYFKKLDINYLPNNQITGIVKKRRGQELMLNDEKIHSLYAGYLLDDENWMKPLEGCYVSYINKYYPKKTEWVFDWKEFNKESAIIRQEEEIEDEPLVKIPDIGIKKTGN